MKATQNTVLFDDSTVNQLLDAIQNRLAADQLRTKQQKAEWMGHYGWATNVVAKALKIGRESLTVRMMADGKIEFEKYVARQRFSDSAKVMLRSYWKRMVRHAKELGWGPIRFALENHWKPARIAVIGVPDGKSIIEHAMNLHLHMHEFSDAVLDGWGKEKQGKGCAYRTVISRKSAFRGAIRRAELAAQFPLLTTSISPTFRLSARQLPPWLRSAIAIIIRRMRSEARLDWRRFPWSSAHGLVLRFGELLGYVQTILKLQINSLEQLLSEPLIRNYIMFLYESQLWKRESIRATVIRIASALSRHPQFEDRDLTWIKACVMELPEDDDTNIDPDFDGTEVVLDDLAAIPGKIRAKRMSLNRERQRVKAWLALKEFVIFWLVTHPWPAQCMRMCRINDPGRNLFWKPLSSVCEESGRFSWIKLKRRQDPRTRFWQFDFSPAHTRLGRYARGPLVPPLAQKLKEYLKYRKELVKGRPDPGTLLVNFAGQPFNSAEFGKLVGDICYEYIGSRVTPSDFRRKFMLDWLAEYPNDIVDVASILWIAPQSVAIQLQRSCPNSAQVPKHYGRTWVRRCRAYWR
jgi:hypothetical protein